MYPEGFDSVGTVLISFRACSRDAYDSLSIFLDAVSPVVVLANNIISSGMILLTNQAAHLPDWKRHAHTLGAISMTRHQSP